MEPNETSEVLRKGWVAGLQVSLQPGTQGPASAAATPVVPNGHFRRAINIYLMGEASSVL